MSNDERVRSMESFLNSGYEFQNAKLFDLTEGFPLLSSPVKRPRAVRPFLGSTKVAGVSFVAQGPLGCSVRFFRKCLYVHVN